AESTLEDTALAAQLPGLDADGDDLLFSFVATPTHGAITGWNRETGSYTYVPDNDFNGPDSFEYQVCDSSGACDAAIVLIDVIPVNDEPLARSSSKSTFQDMSIDFRLIATDPDSPYLTYSILLAPRDGDLTVNAETGAAHYEPSPGYVGGDSFLFRVCDPEGACDTGFVFLHVIDINDSPVASYIETAINQGEPTKLTARATDPDGDPLIYSIASDPLNGTITSFDPLTGEFEYTSDDVYVGPDLIRFQACDASGACDVGVIQLSVVPAGGGGSAFDVCPSVAISEVAWSGTAADADHQWIELRNLEVFPVTLRGWTLRWRAIQPTSPEDHAWRTIPLSGLISEYQAAPSLVFNPSVLTDNVWRVQWSEIPVSDHYLIEIGTDDRVLPELA
ncbi:tandem-95 repeat protein, partial [Candidatus Bipolaricaulota bacterium]|nr:tandem-95 repeat protein [Candidatus Bipolaricaulota bacterium]